MKLMTWHLCQEFDLPSPPGRNLYIHDHDDHVVDDEGSEREREREKDRRKNNQITSAPTWFFTQGSWKCVRVVSVCTHKR